ncbi:MAG: bifunctional riboflavin kinase/FAD synthetase [Lachnospiraceae bacterium]|jgi:riboflavin kinase/FMN adenylyltransferase|nr:bifunctional riboflavin kinase/FAD synthetase [Lachnospiraceae bacterium]
MKLITGQTELLSAGLRPSAVTLGKFDGLHLGHRKLIGEVLKAKEEGLETVVFTFSIPPRAFTEREMQPILLTRREKRAHMERLGIGVLVEYPFTEAVCRMEPEDFVKQVLVRGLQVKRVVTGPDFCFGYRRRGDVELLSRLAAVYGYELTVIEKERDAKGRIISSTLVREELGLGHVEQANELLGYPYTVTGEVVHGNHLGRTFGMPTINQIPAKEKLLPPNGVYTAAIEIDGKIYRGVSNVGYKPTIEGDYPKGVETYIFDFNRDLYGKTLDVQLFHYQRREQKFASVEKLKAQLVKDARESRSFFERHPLADDGLCKKTEK